jgi:nitronate monooxygenase
MTPICQLLGIEHAIVQAPMAGVAHGQLAATVTAAGGLGMLGLRGSEEPDWIRSQAAVAARAGHFGIGLLAWALRDDDAILGTVLAAGPRLVSLSFGDVTPHARAVHDAGALLATQVQRAEAAREAFDAGVDVLVVQGTEAGGHTGQVATLPLLQEVLPLAEAAQVPVLAAGGIATGRAIAGVLAMGAQGAWIGTRFAATREGAGTHGAKARIVAAGSADTVLTHAFDIVQEAAWPDQFPGRALRNRFTDRWHGREDELAAELAGEQATFRDAVERDDREVAHVYAGQASGSIDDLPSAAEVLQRLVAETHHHLRHAAALVPTSPPTVRKMP